MIAEQTHGNTGTSPGTANFSQVPIEHPKLRAQLFQSTATIFAMMSSLWGYLPYELMTTEGRQHY
jgi:hypothetical protein